MVPALDTFPSFGGTPSDMFPSFGVTDSGHVPLFWWLWTSSSIGGTGLKQVLYWWHWLWPCSSIGGPGSGNALVLVVPALDTFSSLGVTGSGHVS